MKVVVRSDGAQRLKPKLILRRLRGRLSRLRKTRTNGKKQPSGPKAWTRFGDRAARLNVVPFPKPARAGVFPRPSDAPIRIASFPRTV